MWGRNFHVELQHLILRNLKKVDFSIGVGHFLDGTFGAGLTSTATSFGPCKVHPRVLDRAWRPSPHRRYKSSCWRLVELTIRLCLASPSGLLGLSILIDGIEFGFFLLCIGSRNSCRDNRFLLSSKMPTWCYLSKRIWLDNILVHILLCY